MSKARIAGWLIWLAAAVDQRFVHLAGHSLHTVPVASLSLGPLLPAPFKLARLPAARGIGILFRHRPGPDPLSAGDLLQAQLIGRLAESARLGPQLALRSDRHSEQAGITEVVAPALGDVVRVLLPDPHDVEDRIAIQALGLGVLDRGPVATVGLLGFLLLDLLDPPRLLILVQRFDTNIVGGRAYQCFGRSSVKRLRLPFPSCHV